MGLKMPKYKCYDVDNSDPEDAEIIDALDEDDAAEEYSEKRDRSNCDYPDERDVAVRLADAPDDTPYEFFAVYLHSTPTYIAYKKKQKVVWRST